MSLFASSRIKVGLAGFALFAIGGVAGGVVGHHAHPAIAMAPLHPMAIRDLASARGIIAVKGRVVESFGNRLVIDDGTGRTLVDTGPRGEEGALAALGSTVTVQGEYGRGDFHPAYLVDATGTVIPLGPPRGFHPGPGRGPMLGDNGPADLPDGRPLAPPSQADRPAG
jgi:hypothetical protein